MRLNCSRNNKISIRNHLDRIRNLLGQNPEDVIRNNPQIAIHLLNGCDLLGSKNISFEMWQHILMDFLTSTLVGPHKHLMKIFSLSHDFSSAKCSVGSYYLHSVLGIGSDSCVYKTTEGYSLKVVEYSRRKKLKREYEILKNLRHPNIVNCFEFICTPDCAAILMEKIYPALGKENDYLQAIAYCHSQGILHGDIRLNNLGSDAKGNSKLFDFGNASAARVQSKKQKEIEILRNIMRSPIALERKSIFYGDVLC